MTTIDRHGGKDTIHQYIKNQGVEKDYKKLHNQPLQFELFVDTPWLAEG